jgi:hypothetical protein
MREMFCSVLEFKEEKWTFVKLEGDNVDFFHLENGRKLSLGQATGPNLQP